MQTRHQILILMTGFLAVLSVCGPSVGQTVQQPIFEQIGVQTSVLVPDRGGVYLGGIKRARESRSSSPFGLGSSIGREISHTGISAHVYISDLREMDDLILNSPDAGYSFGVRFVDSAPHPGRFCDFPDPRMRSPQFVTSINRFPAGPVMAVPGFGPAMPAAVSPVAPPPPAKPETTSLDAARSLRLGQEAEDDGKDGLAILHYRTAAQFGSTLARERLAALGDTMKIKTLAAK